MEQSKIIDTLEKYQRSNQSSTERTTPPSSAHVQLDEVPRTLDLAKCRGRVSSARRRGDDDGDVIHAGFT